MIRNVLWQVRTHAAATGTLPQGRGSGLPLRGVPDRGPGRPSLHHVVGRQRE